MILNRRTFQVLRAILDIGLVVALLVIGISRALPAEANQAIPVQADSSAAINFELTTPENSIAANSAPTGTDLDNNTIAAIIAAENAALNPPQFLLELPFIER